MYPSGSVGQLGTTDLGQFGLDQEPCFTKIIKVGLVPYVSNPPGPGRLARAHPFPGDGKGPREQTQLHKHTSSLCLCHIYKHSVGQDKSNNQVQR